MPDAGLVDAAVIEVLANDPTLTGLCPDGVYWGAAPAGATAFVIVALLDHVDRPALDAMTLYERSVYLVKAVILSAGASQARLAALGIHRLLHDADLDLAPAGYQAMTCRRIERLRLPPELDPVDKAARWQHAGGQYELWSYPTEDRLPPLERIDHATPPR